MKISSSKTMFRLGVTLLVLVIVCVALRSIRNRIAGERAGSTSSVTTEQPVLSGDDKRRIADLEARLAAANSATTKSAEKKKFISIPELEIVAMAPKDGSRSKEYVLPTKRYYMFAAPTGYLAVDYEKYNGETGSIKFVPGQENRLPGNVKKLWIRNLDGKPVTDDIALQLILQFSIEKDEE